MLCLNCCLYHSWLTHYYYDGVLAPLPEYTINTGARHLYLRSSILLLFIRLSSFTTNIHTKRTKTHTQGYNTSSTDRSFGGRVSVYTLGVDVPIYQGVISLPQTSHKPTRIILSHLYFPPPCQKTSKQDYITHSTRY